MKKRDIFLFVILVLTAASAGAAGERAEPVTAVLGAFDAEVELIRSTMTASRDTAVMGMKFTVGRLGDRRVVLARVGYGKVNAAVTTTLLIEHFRPAEVIFTGIAGAVNPDLNPGDIVIGERTAQHDYCTLTDEGPEDKGTVNPVTGERNPLFFGADERLLALAVEAGTRVKMEEIPSAGGRRKPAVTNGTIVTGDAFIASDAKKLELRERFSADAVEMEGAAVAQVCRIMNVPCLVVRSISDRADAAATVDVELFYRIAADNSASFVIELIGLLSGDKK